MVVVGLDMVEVVVEVVVDGPHILNGGGRVGRGGGGGGGCSRCDRISGGCGFGPVEPVEGGGSCDRISGGCGFGPVEPVEDGGSCDRCCCICFQSSAGAFL